MRRYDSEFRIDVVKLENEIGATKVVQSSGFFRNEPKEIVVYQKFEFIRLHI
ncbi:MAG: hypothetical protein FWE33_00380 [Defluviitaleaceae bacterium]|nr:hypothetical protein [Defluviitaleaceae bacterium]